MKKPTSATRGKTGRKTREELNQEARDRKRRRNIVATRQEVARTAAMPLQLVKTASAARSAYWQ
jgi:ribosome assembly protein YihI (activator of Der GTPase)